VTTATAINEEQHRAERASRLFEERLQHFVSRWAPTDYHRRYDFQMDLMRLFVDAMRHQNYLMSAGIDHYASMQFQERSLHSLRVIMEEPKK
jgi:hypothetical protein